jgi:branched-chain amino acid transport system substrate-binding protein
MRRLTLLLILLAVACRREAAPPVAAAPVLRLGMITGVTGPTAAWGEALRRGAQMAVDEHNAQRRAKRVELVILDDQGKPEESGVAAERLIHSDEVAAIVGCDTTSRSMVVSPICERAQIAMISPTASGPALTVGKHFTFRVCATDDGEARAVAHLALERLRAKRVAILRDTKNDYSVGMSETFTKELTAAGGMIVASLDYAEGDSDFRAQLTAVKTAEPDALFVPGYYGDVAQIAAQARDLEISVPLGGGSGWDSPKLIEIGGGSLEGCWFVSGMRSASPRFVDSFRKRYGTEPDAASAQAYDATNIACNAIVRAGTNRVAVRDAIASTTNYSGASGRITIGPDGNARKPLAVFRVEGGRFIEMESIAP